MTDQTRQELLRIVAELSEMQPDVRLGQLITNLSYAARGYSNEGTWDVQDTELISAAKEQLEPVAHEAPGIRLSRCKV